LEYLIEFAIGPSSTDDNVESPRTSTASNLSDVKSTSTTKHNVESEDESVNGDEFGSTDEVKVFKDEDEPDCSESYQAELLAEKSSLINESEQASLKLVVVVVVDVIAIVVDTNVDVVVDRCRWC